jgi:CRP-like cAMP-binding protein
MNHSKLFELISQKMPLEEIDAGFIKNYFEPLIIEKNVLLEEQNRIANHLYFINDGFVRVFHIDDGVEITTQIHGNRKFVTSFNSFITGNRSMENVKSITECNLLRMTKEGHDSLFKQNSKWAGFCKRIYESAISTYEQRTNDLLTLSAEKRYLKLLSTQPEIIGNIPIQYIASYIGIKPESLSRIRRQVIS